MPTKQIRYKEDMSMRSTIFNGDTLHKIDIFVGKDYIDTISVLSKNLKYFIVGAK